MTNPENRMFWLNTAQPASPIRAAFHRQSGLRGLPPRIPIPSTQCRPQVWAWACSDLGAPTVGVADSRAGCWFKALCAVLHSNKPEPSDSHSSATTAWPGRSFQRQEETSHIRTGSNRCSRQGVLYIPTQETRLWEPPCPQRRWSPVVDRMTGDTKPASLSYTRPLPLPTVSMA